MDAEDIQKNLDLLASDAAVGSSCLYCGQWAHIYDHTEVIDPHTIRIHLSSAYPFLFNLLPPIGGSDMYIFSVDAWERGGMTSEGYEEEGAIGTGPWKFEDRNIGQFARYSRWDEYYSNPFRARFEELEFILAAEDATRLATVSTGGADMANMTGLFAPEIEAAGLSVDGPKMIDNAYIAFYQSYDTGHCTNKLEVRKALNLAVDVDTIIEALWPGGTATRISHSFTSPFVEGWDPTLEPYAYDPEEARRLLEESGCAGMRVNAYAAYGPATPEFKDMVEAVATYWGAAGIDVNLIPIEAAAYQARRRAEQMGADREDNPIGPHWIPTSRNFGDMIRTHGICPSNGGGSTCGLPEQERWLERMQQYFDEQDPEVRNELARQISLELHEYYPHLPIAARDAVWALDGNTICDDWQPVDGTAVALMLNTVEPC
jgi:peptide/nickel transport system substrate-binding protein